MNDPVFAPWNAGLGDQWATISLLLHRWAVSAQFRPSLLHSPAHLRSMHYAIGAELLNGVNGVKLVDAPPTHQLAGFDVWACPVWPTNVRWQPYERHAFATYQFDGISAARDKNPTEIDQALILQRLDAWGIPTLPLGKHLTLRECTQYLAASSFFVGCDSGMSHLAHSVGTHCFLLEYNLPVVTCHRGKAYIQCAGTEDFLRHKLPTWIDYLRFIEHIDGQSTRIPSRPQRDELDAQRIAWWTPNA